MIGHCREDIIQKQTMASQCELCWPDQSRPNFRAARLELHQLQIVLSLPGSMGTVVCISSVSEIRSSD